MTEAILHTFSQTAFGSSHSHCCYYFDRYTLLPPTFSKAAGGWDGGERLPSRSTPCGESGGAAYVIPVVGGEKCRDTRNVRLSELLAYYVMT